jgi:hypothetical protein
MPDFAIRKIEIVQQDILHDGGPAGEPHRRAAALAVVKNPFAGRYVEDLQPAMEALKPLGALLTRRMIEALGDKAAIDSYGKGAIVGTAGEIEHGALWHVPGGYAMREQLGGAKAIVPSAMKVGGFGATLDIPLGHVNAAYVRSHFDAFTVGVADGPKPDEIVFALAMAIGGRVHARMGGLAVGDIAVWDGQR